MTKERTVSRRAALGQMAALGVAALAGPACRPGSSPAIEGRRLRLPNFVFILADDLGYQDIGCFGSTKNRTPNLDRMAAEGTRFTSFCSTSGVCTPSRSSLMTGCYPRRVGLHEDEDGEWVLFPVARKGLHPGEITVARLLKEKGYATAYIGKWHLGDQPPFLPTRHGFDRFFGLPYSNDMGSEQRPRNPPLPLMRDDAVIEAPADQDTLTEKYTREAVRVLSENKDRPFFLLLSHFVPHTPLHSGAKFRGMSANGKYGDAVEELDGSTGEILASLRALGLDRRTLVVFTSDNGGVRKDNNGPLAGTKGSTLEGGMRVPFIARWPGRVPAGKTCRELATMMDVLPTFAALAGLEPPRDRRIDGKNIVRLLERPETERTPHEVFYYYFMGQLQAVRAGRWKLHLPLPRKRHGWHLPPYEEKGRLYDLEADPGESRDLFASNPAIVARLTKRAEEARRDIGDEDRDGQGQRPAGWVETARPLSLKKS
jgi:arylsulfatase A-like enzyme